MRTPPLETNSLETDTEIITPLRNDLAWRGVQHGPKKHLSCRDRFIHDGTTVTLGTVGSIFIAFSAVFNEIVHSFTPFTAMG